jgi:zinc/manganese transport system substrate-binding protein
MPDRRSVISGLALLAGTAFAGAAAAPGSALAQAGNAAPAVAAAPMPVVATFSILGDFIAQVGRDRLALTSLVQAGADAHVYSPTPADARALVASRLIFINGLGFEGWVNRLIRSSATKATVVTATRSIVPLKAEKKGGGHSHAGHDHGENDPHAWQSVANAKLYVANIEAALVTADPANAETYRTNAKAYTAKLDALDAELRAGIARIPADRRKIITSHDAFQYFEKAYGVTFISPRGVSTSAEPSPQAVGRIIRQIRDEKIPAVFLENISDQRLIQRIAQETGARVGGTLYSDSLTAAGGPAPDYIAMMRHNLSQIVGALAGA